MSEHLEHNKADSAPKISVIIPCFNQGQYIKKAIASVLASDFQDFEIIVVNDGSTDATTVEILKNLSSPKTRVIHQDNRGLAGARQAGTEASSGKYFLPLDADDKIHSNYLGKAYALLEANPQIGYVYTHYQMFGDENFVYVSPRYNFYKLLWDGYINACCLTRRAAWQAAGGYATSIVNGYSDWCFLISLGKVGWHGLLLPEVMFSYRRHAGAMTLKAVKRHAARIADLKDFHHDIFNSRENLRRLRREWGGFSFRERAVRLAKRLTQHRWFPPELRRRLRALIYGSR